ncbi:hypothetical protein ACJX0J_006646 [Zea mays]
MIIHLLLDKDNRLTTSAVEGESKVQHENGGNVILQSSTGQALAAFQDCELLTSGKLFSEPGKKKRLQQENFVGYVYLQLPNKAHKWATNSETGTWQGGGRAAHDLYCA